MIENELVNCEIRSLTREELDLAIEWAAQEGWNPGLHDAEVFWNADPDGFLGVECDGELVATGSVVSYGGNYGFMGFFIVRGDLRGKGIGTKLWFHRRDILRSRLKSSAAIGMDGVFEMQDWYAKGGFEFSHRNLRMEGVAWSTPANPSVVDLASIPIEKIARYDLECFGCAREGFLKDWIAMPESKALGFKLGSDLKGYGVIRRCRIGYKVGPLFANDAFVAESLLDALVGEVEGEPVFLDLPEVNLAGVALAQKRGMTEVFGCARMYHGKPARVDWSRIFGITTFELG